MHRYRNSRPRRRTSARLHLTFTPLAWLKLQYFCHVGNTEIAGFGIATARDPLVIEDFVTIPQEADTCTVRFADADVADFFDHCVDNGLPPQRFARVWCHTHPGASVTPSSTDEATFARAFGGCDWSLMFILGRTGRTYARLGFAAGPGSQMTIPTRIDWSAWPDWLAQHPEGLGSLHQCWQQEYLAHVQICRNPVFLDRTPRLFDIPFESIPEVISNAPSF